MGSEMCIRDRLGQRIEYDGDIRLELGVNLFAAKHFSRLSQQQFLPFDKAFFSFSSLESFWKFVNLSDLLWESIQDSEGIDAI